MNSNNNMSGSNKGDNIETDRCCDGPQNGQRCFCLPYDDVYMITAQVLSIVAFTIAWVWWVSFTIGLIVLVLLQIIWCCRQSKAGIVAASIISVIASIVCLFIGIWLIIYRKDTQWCTAFTLEYDDDDTYSYSRDYCPEKVWASISFVDAVLWLLTGHFSIMFLWTGRYDKWEAKYRPSNNKEDTGGAAAVATAVEMGNVNTTDAAAVAPEDPKMDETSGAVPSATATAVLATSDAYVPPQIAENVGEA